MNIKKTSLYTC